MKPCHRTVAAILAIVVLTVAAFLPVLRAEFLLYDDQEYVTENSAVLGGLDFQGIGWAFTSLEAANWHPLTWVSHMLDVSLFGLRPGAHHATSLILHATAAALLFLLLKGLTGGFWSSLLGAAVFAVHPQRVESVAWISERKDVLAGLFWLLTLLAYLRYARRPATGRYLTVIALFVLGLMSKSMLVTLPFVLLVLDWWPLGRLHTGHSSASFAPAVNRRGTLLEKVPLLLPTIATSVVTYFAQQHGGVIPSSVHFPPAQRIGNAVVSFVKYLGKTVWPLDLYPFYPHPGASLPLTEIVLSLALLAVITAAALSMRNRRPWILAGWLWYLGTLIPVIGLVQTGEQGMADRYSYLPSIGLLIAVCGEARSRVARWVWGPRLAGAAAIALLVVLAFLTWRQTGYWRNTATFANRMLAGNPRSSTALNLLGADRLQRGDGAGAVSFLTRAIELRPGFLDARFNLGMALAARGSTEEAIQQFTTILRARPDDVQTLANRGKLLLERRLAEQALRDLDSALALAPGQPQIILLRGLALAQLGASGTAPDGGLPEPRPLTSR